MTKLETRQVERSTARETLFDLQVEQYHHDEIYHREIARLPLHHHLNHMALHFSKYAGKVAKAGSIVASVPVIVDTLIIALSTTNVLNLDLWDELEPTQVEYTNLSVCGRTLALRVQEDIEDHPSLVFAMTIAAGEMAATCEKIDHLESVLYRKEVTQVIARLATIAFAILAKNDIDPAFAVRERLAGVKARLKLHGRI